VLYLAMRNLAEFRTPTAVTTGRRPRVFKSTADGSPSHLVAATRITLRLREALEKRSICATCRRLPSAPDRRCCVRRSIVRRPRRWGCGDRRIGAGSGRDAPWCSVHPRAAGRICGVIRWAAGSRGRDRRCFPRGREVPGCGGAVWVCTSRACCAGGRLADRAGQSVGRSYLLIVAGWRVGDVRVCDGATGGARG
jgi:hypothetical protein